MSLDKTAAQEYLAGGFRHIAAATLAVPLGFVDYLLDVGYEIGHALREEEKRAIGRRPMLRVQRLSELDGISREVRNGYDGIMISPTPSLRRSIRNCYEERKPQA